MAAQPGSAKAFVRGVIQKGDPQSGAIIFIPLLSALESGEFRLEGRVRDANSHYVHENSTAVELDTDLPEQYDKLVVSFEKFLEDQHRTWNRKLTRELYQELEHQNSDEAIIESLDANDVHFDDTTGAQVDMDDFVFIHMLPGDVQARVCQEYAELFDVAPEKVRDSLERRKAVFDMRGNRVDTSHFKLASELPDALKAKVVEKHRDWNTQDEMWSEWITDEWKRRLESMGYDRVEIRYDLSYSQGSGASFIAGYFDGKKLIQGLLSKQKQEAKVQALLKGLVG
jgi:hypothetical protein